MWKKKYQFVNSSNGKICLRRIPLMRELVLGTKHGKTMISIKLFRIKEEGGYIKGY